MLYIISIVQVGEVLQVQGTVSIRRVSTKFKACHAANNVTRKIKKHVSRKGVWRMCDQGPLGREGAPLMVSRAFAVALPWMHIFKSPHLFKQTLQISLSLDRAEGWINEKGSEFRIYRSSHQSKGATYGCKNRLYMEASTWEQYCQYRRCSTKCSQRVNRNNLVWIVLKFS